MEHEHEEGGEKKILHATINGVAVEAEENETILHCARRYGVYIPTLCELDDIDHTPGTCRVCLVEFEMPSGDGKTKLATSCNTPVVEGMVVQTRSPRARSAQRLQVELILADHDQDCATCVRHGSCELQDVAQFVGLHENRFYNPSFVEKRPVDDSSPAMIRDMSKCVRCQRCIAICRDGQGVDALFGVVVPGAQGDHELVHQRQDGTDRGLERKPELHAVAQKGEAADRGRRWRRGHWGHGVGFGHGVVASTWLSRSDSSRLHLASMSMSRPASAKAGGLARRVTRM